MSAFLGCVKAHAAKCSLQICGLEQLDYIYLPHTACLKASIQASSCQGKVKFYQVLC